MWCREGITPDRGNFKPSHLDHVIVYTDLKKWWEACHLTLWKGPTRSLSCQNGFVYTQPRTSLPIQGHLVVGSHEPGKFMMLRAFWTTIQGVMIWFCSTQEKISRRPWRTSLNMNTQTQHMTCSKSFPSEDWEVERLLCVTVRSLCCFVGSRFTNGNLDWVAPDDFHPEATDSATDFEKNEFLDLRKPLLRQVWEANFRSAYLFHVISWVSYLNWCVKQSILSPASTSTPTFERICANVWSWYSRGTEKLLLIHGVQCLMQMSNRFVRERSGMSCLYFGPLSQSICSCALSSNSLDLFRPSSKIPLCPCLTSPFFPRTPLWRQCYVFSSETLFGQFWNTLCTVSCFISTTGFQINPYSWSFISQHTEFIITFPWIGMFSLGSIVLCKPL